MAAYLGVYIFQSTQSTLQTSPAVRATLTDTAELTGIAVRREEVPEGRELAAVLRHPV